MLAPPEGSQAKTLGAYYTPKKVAEFLTTWAIRSGQNTTLDPSFGGGVFLEASLDRLERLGAETRDAVYGAELDAQTYAQVKARLRGTRGDLVKLVHQDFFSLMPGDLPCFDALVGNPPFIRYQRFSGEARARAHAAALAQGVRLSKRSSAWAAFLIHSCAHLKLGGRLAMVIPAELGHAAYARPVLAHLLKTFERTTLITFEQALFPDLSQDTLLVLAEDKGGKAAKLYLSDVATSAQLGPDTARKAQEIESTGLIAGTEKLPLYWLPKKTRALYKSLARSDKIHALDKVAEVGIGYVTGNNSFFHLSKQEVKAKGIAKTHLESTLFRGRALRGLYFDETDWAEAEGDGEAGYLLALAGKNKLSKNVQTYLSEGETEGVPEAYKCRIRKAWFEVPHVYRADAFLSYMSGHRPQLVVNKADAVAPNSLHVVRLRGGVKLSVDALAAAWQTSLTSLSVELEGHALGGGMLKLEPGEARKVLLPALSPTSSVKLCKALDGLLRQRNFADAEALADRHLLQRKLGVEKELCDTLSEAANQLRKRRIGRKA